MKFISKFVVPFMALIGFIISLLVVIKFIYIVFIHYKIFIPETYGLNEVSNIGDFLSGFLNGFILLTIIISLYFQRTSISQTWESIKQQAESNETISKDLQNSISSNMLLTKEFITTNYKNEFNIELKCITNLMSKIKIKELCESNFKEFIVLDNDCLIELLQRKNYLASLLIKIEDNDLKNSLMHKIDTANVNIYINKHEKMLKKVFVFNELLKVFNNYYNYILYDTNIQDIEEVKNLKNIYAFIMKTIDEKYLSKQNRFQLFENIASSNNLFEKYLNFEFNPQLLWNIILTEKFHVLEDYYNIIVQDYDFLFHKE